MSGCGGTGSVTKATGTSAGKSAPSTGMTAGDDAWAARRVGPARPSTDVIGDSPPRSMGNAPSGGSEAIVASRSGAATAAETEPCGAGGSVDRTGPTSPASAGVGITLPLGVADGSFSQGGAPKAASAGVTAARRG